jgi:hypothetical protein
MSTDLAIATDLNLLVVIPRVDKMVDMLKWNILAGKTSNKFIIFYRISH